jgi:Helix-turn-helix domain
MTPGHVLKRAKVEQNHAERLLEIAAVARRLTVTPETVRAWCRAKKIRFFKTPTGRYKVPAEVVDAIENKNADSTDSTDSKRSA